METTHRTLHTTSSSNKITVPFYAPPRGCKKTSAEIISEARAAIAHEYATNLSISSTRMAASIRPVNTKRPFTPRERERTLFGRSKKSTYRPPSSFSLDCLQFQEQEHVPVTPPHLKKLNPLPLSSSLPSNVNTTTSSANFVMWKDLFHSDSTTLGLSYYAAPLSGTSSNPSRFRLPSIHWTAKPQSKRSQFSTGSLGNLPEELEEENELVEEDYRKDMPPPRKAYSSPTQRTQSVFDGKFIANINVPQFPPTNKKTYQHLNLEQNIEYDRIIIKNEAMDSSNELFLSASKLPWTQRKKIHSKREGTLTKEKLLDVNCNSKETACTVNMDVSAHCPGNENSTDAVSFNHLDNKQILQLQNQDKLFSTTNPKDSHSNIENRADNKCAVGKENSCVTMSNILTDFSSENSEVLLEPAVSNNAYSQLQTISAVNEEICKENAPQKMEAFNNVTVKLLSHELSQVNNKNDSLHTIMKEMKCLIGQDTKEKESVLIAMLHKLFDCLKLEGVIGNKFCNTKQKPQVLKLLYEFVDVSSDEVLLEIARIILALQVAGSNLSGVCKLIFKVSRNDKNDKLFLNGNILELFVEALGSLSPLDDAEACVYGYGALKFLTMNNVLLQKVIKLGILELMVLHMKIVNVARQENSSIPEQTNHALFQLTGALRNVAGEEDMFSFFIQTGTVTELCTSLELFSSDLDVVSNISRTFSVISAHDECCSAIVDHDGIFGVFVKLIQKYPGHQDIIVRLGYALGNLMAKSDDARRKFFNEKGSMSSLLSLLKIYLEKDKDFIDAPGMQNNMSQVNAGSSGSVEDVIIKTVRIIANMSINAVVGNTLVWDFQHNIITKNGCNNVKEGGQLLDILLGLLHRKSVQDSGELVHSVLSTLNNLSYYPCDSNTSLSDRQLEIAQVLYTLLRTANIECLIEATRVCGNLTRSKNVRDFLFESGGMEQLLTFLESSDNELLCTTVGVIINMMADWDKRLAFKQENGITKLICALKKYGEDDWLLATLICQALWNYCIESPDLYSAFAAEDMNNLLGLLADFLDEERLFGIKEGCEASESVQTMASFQAWEDFSGVATDLLERLEAFLDTLQPLEAIMENLGAEEGSHLEPLYIPDVSMCNTTTLLKQV